MLSGKIPAGMAKRVGGMAAGIIHGKEKDTSDRKVGC
jgi:hypothetical protein